MGVDQVADQVQVEVREQPLTNVAADHLNLAAMSPGDIATADDWWRAAVKSGALDLLGVYVAGEHVGTLAYRIEQEENGAEFVLVIAGGDAGRFDLTMEALPLVLEQARSLGCVVARAHSARLGLLKKLQLQGWAMSEVVMRKALA